MHSYSDDTVHSGMSSHNKPVSCAYVDFYVAILNSGFIKCIIKFHYEKSKFLQILCCARIAIWHYVLNKLPISGSHIFCINYNNSTYVAQNIAMRTSSMLAIGLYNNTLGCNLLSVSHAVS